VVFFLVIICGYFVFYFLGWYCWFLNCGLVLSVLNIIDVFFFGYIKYLSKEQKEDKGLVIIHTGGGGGVKK
jgi:hypothetical protein